MMLVLGVGKRSTIILIHVPHKWISPFAPKQVCRISRPIPRVTLRFLPQRLPYSRIYSPRVRNISTIRQKKLHCQGCMELSIFGQILMRVNPTEQELEHTQLVLPTRMEQGIRCTSSCCLRKRRENFSPFFLKNLKVFPQPQSCKGSCETQQQAQY